MLSFSIIYCVWSIFGFFSFLFNCGFFFCEQFKYFYVDAMIDYIVFFLVLFFLKVALFSGGSSICSEVFKVFRF